MASLSRRHAALRRMQHKLRAGRYDGCADKTVCDENETSGDGRGFTKATAKMFVWPAGSSARTADQILSSDQRGGMA